jgi:hypothetical protein
MEILPVGAQLFHENGQIDENDEANVASGSCVNGPTNYTIISIRNFV